MGTISLLQNLHLTRQSPISLVHFVTQRCNARCPFCFIDFDAPNAFMNELTLEEIDQITRTTGPHLQNVNLTGGEPFARKDLLDIARCWFRNTNIRSIFITSNGSLPERMEAFARAMLSEFPERKVIFSISIDAFNKQHDDIRQIKGLFENALKSYHALLAIGGDTMANVAITISHANHAIAIDLYNALINDYGVKAITATAVRDEGVFKTPVEEQEAIQATYAKLTTMIDRDLHNGRLSGFDTSSLQGRLMNEKNSIVNKIIQDTYLDPVYVSPCRAGTLFGVIGADGSVYPCEILDKCLGNLRDTGLNFMSIWKSQETKDTECWVLDSKCHCTYECAWTLNVLSNARYQPKLIKAALGL